MKTRILIMFFCVAILFSACSSENSSEEKAVLSEATSFSETDGYEAYIKDFTSYGVYKYDIASLTKTDIGVSISVNNSETSFLHSYLHDDYIYIISSSIYSDSFVLRMPIDNPSDMQKITFSDSEYITFEKGLDNAIFSNDSLYLILTKNNMFSDGSSDYLTRVDFIDSDYDRLSKLPSDAAILACYQDLIYLNAVENPVKILYSYNASEDELETLKENLILTSTYKIDGNNFYTMNAGNTGIKSENLQTRDIIDITVENTVPRSSLVGVYDNRVIFGYERLDVYHYFNMNLDGMGLTEMFLFYNDEQNIPPKIIAQTSNSFIVQIENERSEVVTALISKTDFWNNRENFMFFS